VPDPTVTWFFAAVKAVIAGPGTTFTVNVNVAGTLAVFVTVSMKVVLVVRLPVETGTPLVTAPTPLLTTPVPPVNTAVSVVLVPAVTGFLAAVKLAIVGSGGRGLPPPPPPQPLQARSAKATRGTNRQESLYQERS
jgi:hypothetical protein